jgi:hypothetical protein
VLSGDRVAFGRIDRQPQAEPPRQTSAVGTSREHERIAGDHLDRAGDAT